MSVEATSVTAAAEAISSPEADLDAAFVLSIREAVARLQSITDEERTSNTAIDRAARTALQFLRAAAEAHSIGALRKKEKAENDDERPVRAPNPDEVERFKELLARKLHGHARDSAGGGAEGEERGGVRAGSGGVVS